MEKTTRLPRPPIVSVLGHVDHGKTSLLDYIRKTSVAAREAGGITQSIGAFRVTTKNGKKITFIDTPGHEAFSQMRSRGARVADIVILVVAADDGVMPQTQESLGFIKEAEVPFIIAITKIDLPTAQPEKVKTQLAQNGVLLEGRGGDVVALEVSSKTGKGVEDLLEMISLVAELHGVSGDPKASPEAPIIETGLDPQRGPVVRTVVREGTLKIGDMIGAEGISAKVRGLFDENRKPIKEAGSGTPVEILGFSGLPPVGSVISVPGELQASTPRVAKAPARGWSASGGKIQGFPVVLKADTAGSLEAIIASLSGKVGILGASIGDIAEGDIVRASTIGAPIVGFNVKVGKDILALAEEEGVRIYTYKIIYELLSDVEKWAREKEELGQEKILGKAQIVAEFPHNKTRIAGCRVISGRVVRSDKLRLVRGSAERADKEEVLGTVFIKSLRRQKEEISKAEAGEEFGVFFEPQLDFKIGDVLESFAPPKEPAS
ncbi:MAG: GTP-binding protein [Candidatus Blackburnbacteria bacterium]|nr:GTP-binding protein [Candidatus Blackburnbacteria bacterium]